MNTNLPYQVFYNFLNIDEINILKTYFNNIDNTNILYTNKWDITNKVISDIRKSSSSGRQVHITGIQKDMFPIITNKIQNLFDSILGGNSTLEYPHFLTQYSVGSFHLPHTDFQSNEWYREKVVTIQLSDTNEYVGGDLKIGEHILPRDIGCALVYNGKDVHEVTMVTDGVRFSLTECAGIEPTKHII